MITELVDCGLQAGRKMLEALTTQPAARGRGFVEQVAGRRTSCGCDIPPPCWMPVQLRDVRSEVCRGATAVLRFRVTNCGLGTRDVSVSWVVEASTDSEVTCTQTTITLGPFERGELEITARANKGELVLLVWVGGCKDYVLRWTVHESRRGCDSTHEVDIDDCPDLVHHWYDHFYCERPCHSRVVPPVTPAVDG